MYNVKNVIIIIVKIVMIESKCTLVHFVDSMELKYLKLQDEDNKLMITELIKMQLCNQYNSKYFFIKIDRIF